MITQEDAQAMQDATQALEGLFDELSAKYGMQMHPLVRVARWALKSFHTALEQIYAADGGDVTTLSGGANKTEP